MSNSDSDEYTNPKSWGPHFWFIMKCVANNYSNAPSEEEKKYTQDFYLGLQYILPCKMCQYTYKSHIQKTPIDGYLGSKAKLIEWVNVIQDETSKTIAKNRIKIIDKDVNETPKLVKNGIIMSTAPPVKKETITIQRNSTYGIIKKFQTKTPPISSNVKPLRKKLGIKEKKDPLLEQLEKYTTQVRMHNQENNHINRGIKIVPNSAPTPRQPYIISRAPKPIPTNTVKKCKKCG